MNELHNKLIIDSEIVPKEGQRGLLCSNNESIRCPSLGIIDEEEQSLDCLASILVEAFVKKKRNEQKSK